MVIGANPIGAPYLADAYALGAGSSATLSRSSAYSLDGSYSLKIVVGDEGTVQIQVGPYPVMADDTYSFTAAFLAPSAEESAYAGVAWYDGESYLSTSDGSLITTSDEWQGSSGTATAPASATLAFVEFVIESAPSSSVYYVDGVGLFSGSTAVWSYPGVGVASQRTISYTDGVMVSAM